MYVPDFLELKDAPGRGKGLFSKTEIKAGTKLGVYTGIKYSRTDFINKYGHDFRYCCYSRFPWAPITCAKDDRHFITYINESKTPNVYLKRCKLYALVDIKENEELFLRYPEDYPRDYEL